VRPQLKLSSPYRSIVAYVVAIVLVVAVPLGIGTALLFDRQGGDIAQSERKGIGLEETVRLDALQQRLRALRRWTVRRGNVSLADRLSVETAFTRVRDYALGPGRALQFGDSLARLSGVWYRVPERGQALRQVDRTIAAALDFSRLVDQRSTLRSDSAERTTALVDAFTVQMPIVGDRADQEQNLLLAAYRSHRNLGGAALGVGIFSAQADRAYRTAALDVEHLAPAHGPDDAARRAIADIGRHLDQFRARVHSAARGSLHHRRDAKPFIVAGEALAASIDVGTSALARAIRYDFVRRLEMQRASVGRLRIAAGLATACFLLLCVLLGRALLARQRREASFMRGEAARVGAEAEHRRARDQLALTEARFEAVFDRTSLGIAIFDGAGTPVRRNDALRAMFPSDDADYIGVHEAAFARLIAGDIAAYTIERAHSGVSRLRWTEADVSTVRGDAGEMLFAIAIVKDVTDRREAEDRLRHDARFDALVDLPNRAYLVEWLTAMLHEPHGDGMRGLAFVALDEFAAIVDSLGQNVGDRILVEAAARLCACVDGRDLAARLGGSDFALAFGRRAGRAEIVDGLECVVRALERPYVVDGREICVRPRAGLVAVDRAYASVEALFADVDSTMFAAKAAGTTRYAIFEPAMRDRASRRLDVLANLRRALERDQLHLLFQPIVSLDTQRVVAFEVLLRWEHPELGSVSPSEFVPIAEEAGLVRPIGRWVFERACAQLEAWRRSGEHRAPAYLSVNVSVHEMMQRDYTDFVEATLARHALGGHDIVMEITEGVVLSSDSEAQRSLDRLRAAGVRFSIDDFGTGFSSLRYLQAFRFDFLKIDQSFVLGGSDGLASPDIVAMIVALGAAVGVTVVAEGVETTAQAAHLRALGARLGQGYLFGRPLAASALPGLGAQRRSIAAVG